MIDRQDELLSKQGKIVKHMADDLLNRQVEDRVPSMQDYAGQFSASVGTVQSAANYLQAEGIATMVSRGRLGAFVDKLDYVALWHIARNRPMAGVQPLPYSRQLAGLATALRTQFSAHAINSSFRYVRGSNTRMQMLQSGESDWIVASRYAADSAQVYGFDLDVAFSLGQATYTMNRVLLFREGIAPELRDGLRFGIDGNSTDHAYLVRSLSQPYAIKFVEIEYQRGIEHLQANDIDVAIWTSTESTPSGLHVAEIKTDDKRLIPLSEAVIMTRPNDRATQHVLSDILDLEAIQTIQHEVVTSQRLPSY